MGYFLKSTSNMRASYSLLKGDLAIQRSTLGPAITTPNIAVLCLFDNTLVVLWQYGKSLQLTMLILYRTVGFMCIKQQ